jgi:hypothetical protein
MFMAITINYGSNSDKTLVTSSSEKIFHISHDIRLGSQKPFFRYLFQSYPANNLYLNRGDFPDRL